MFSTVQPMEKYRGRLLDHNLSGGRQISGLTDQSRIFELEHAIYDPAAPNSRLGITAAQFKAGMEAGLWKA